MVTRPVFVRGYPSCVCACSITTPFLITQRCLPSLFYPPPPLSCLQVERVRDLYARAVANVPLVREKRYWERYIYLWVYYVVYEETEAGDIDKAREGYQGKFYKWWCWVDGGEGWHSWFSCGQGRAAPLLSPHPPFPATPFCQPLPR